MATLVLSTVGGLIGGPVGAAVGTLLGEYLDQKVLFPQKPREGPRLNDLAVQLSRYGAAVPRIYGTMRVAGTVIWAPPLKEHRTRRSGGKRGPDTVSYDYSASFAVALSSRRAVRVGRIWADGKLLRGADGQFVIDARMRFYPGDADQPLDPLIASAEGMGAAPAYRGIAYVLFEDLPLADFGNRIPQLSFELIADEDGTDMRAICADVSDGGVAADAGTRLGGYAANAETARDAVAPLASLTQAGLWRDAAGWRLGDGGPVLAQSALPHVPERHQRSRGRPAARALALRHYEPARDYQIGMQRVPVAGGSRREMQMDMAISCGAATARGLAAGLALAMTGRQEKRRLVCGPAALACLPGTRIALANAVWRVERWRWEGSAAHVELAPCERATVALPADPGRVVSTPPPPSGAFHVALFDLPNWLAPPSDTPRITVLAASEAGQGFYESTLRLPSGELRPLPRRADAAVLGYAVGVLAAGQAVLVDGVNSVEVVLVNPAMQLANASDTDLANGANAAMLGREMIQFGRAEPLGGQRYRLSRLWRGRGGTEWAMTTHAAGESFAALERIDDAAALDLLPLTGPLTAGTVIELRRPGSDRLVVAPVPDGLSGVAPLGPSHLRMAREPDGGIALNWVRRSRAGFAWRDFVDAPLAEDKELYAVTLSGGSGSLRRETGAPRLSIGRSDIIAVAAAGTPVRVSVVQLGTAGPSAAAIIDIIS